MFTLDERPLVRLGLDGLLKFAEGSFELGTALQTGLTTASRPAFIEAFKQTTRASRDACAGAFGLFGAMPEDENEETRGEQLDLAFYHIRRAIEDCLPTAANAVRAVSPKAADLIIEAQRHFFGLNHAALLHSDPPSNKGITFGGRRPVVGPHGDYYRHAHFGWTQTHYMDDWAQEGFLPVLAGCALNVRVPMGESWRLHADLTRLQTYVIGLQAGIPLHSRWENLPVLRDEPQFSLTVAARGIMLRGSDLRKGDGIPAWFSAHENAWLDVLPGVRARAMPAWIQGSRRRSDAWKRENEQAWQGDVFPDGRAG